MKKIYNNIIPLKGFTALTIWPFVFIRKDMAWAYNTQAERHEAIHGCQQREMLVVLFLLWYGIEWLVKWAYYRNRMTAYKNISFEREAYAHQNDASYLDDRRLFAWLKYLKN